MDLDAFESPTPKLAATPADARLFVQFFKKSTYDKPRSVGYVGEDGKDVKGAGRPIYKMADWIRIANPGDQWNMIEREVLPGDQERFPLQWAAFLNEKNQETAAGTPLSVLTSLASPILNEAQVDEFKHARIHTVEQLAELPDVLVQKFFGAQRLKQQAKAWLETTKSDGKFDKLLADSERKDNEIAALQSQIKAIAEQMHAQQAKKAEAKK